MILSGKEILKEIKKGRIKIEPFEESQVGPASIDLHLDNQFRIFPKGSKVINITEDFDYQKYTKLVRAETILLKPGEFILGLTKEKITLPDNICGTLTGRSRFARIGVSIHITASFIQPGIDNKQVLEIKNVSHETLKLYSGVKICQLVLEEMKGKAKYVGTYKNQNSL